MIVVDTNVIASLLLPTSQHTVAAMQLLETERDWAAPMLWRSEFCNVLATGVRNDWLSAEQAMKALSNAEEAMDGSEFHVPAAEVLRTAIASNCTAYDSEFVVLAQDLGVKLVTLDRAILQAFPDLAVPL
ncbi:MAG: type II toxin-antitoxin system VapC family toxin, partial [bacterium]|nr:type II toxin-antitoxin system VapC family toxin [bacterium]